MALKLKTSAVTHIVEYREDNDIPNSPVLAKFHTKPLTPSELNKLLEKHKKYVWDSPTKREQKQRFPEEDNIAFTHDHLDRVIVGWEGVEDDETDEPLECTRENKIMIFEFNPEIIRFVLEKTEEIAKLEEEHKEEKRKNSKATQTKKRKLAG